MSTSSGFAVKNPMFGSAGIEMKQQAAPSPYAFYTDKDNEDSDDDSDTDIRASIAEKPGVSLDTEYLAEASQSKLNKRAKIKQESVQKSKRRFSVMEQRRQFPSRSYMTVFPEAKHSVVKSVTVYVPLDVGRSPEIICGSDTGIISVFHAVTGCLIRRLDNKTGDQIKCLAVYDPKRVAEALPDYPLDESFRIGRVLLVSAGYDTHITVWDYAEGEVLRTLKGHQWFISSLVIHCLPPGILFISEVESLRTKRPISSSTDRAYNNSTSSSSSAVALPMPLTVGATAKSQSKETDAGIKGRRETEPRLVIVSSSFDCIAQLWDLHTGEKLFRITGQRNEMGAVCVMPLSFPVRAKQMNSDGIRSIKDWQSYLVAGLFQKLMVLYDLKTRSRLFVFPAASVLPSVVNCMSASCSSVGNDNCTLLISGHSDGSACVWSAVEGNLLADLDGKHTVSISAVSLVYPHDTVKSGRQVGGTAAGRTAKRQSLISTNGQRENDNGEEDNEAVVVQVHCPSEDVKRRIAAMMHKKESRAPIAVKMHDDDDKKDKSEEEAEEEEEEAKAQTSKEDMQSVVEKHAQFVKSYRHMDGMLAVTASVDGAIYVWDLVSASAIRSLHSFHACAVHLQTYCLPPIAISSANSTPANNDPMRNFSSSTYGNEMHVVCGFEGDGGVISYDLTCQEMRRFDGRDAAQISCSTLFDQENAQGEQEKVIITGSSDLSVWKLPSCTLARTLPSNCKNAIIHSVMYFKPKTRDFDVYLRERHSALAGVMNIGLLAVFSYQGQRSLYSVETMEEILEYQLNDPVTTTATLWSPGISSSLSSSSSSSDFAASSSASCTETLLWYDELRPMIIVAHKAGTVSVLDLFSGKLVRFLSNEDMKNKLYLSKIIVHERGGGEGAAADSSRPRSGGSGAEGSGSGSGSPELVCVNGEVLFVFDLNSCKIVRSADCGHTDKTTDLCFHYPVAGVQYKSSVLCQHLLISCSMDRTLIVRSYKDLKALFFFTASVHSAAIYSVKVFDPSISKANSSLSNSLVAGEYVGKASSGATHTEDSKTHDHQQQKQQHVLVVLLTAGGDGKIVVWDLHSCVPLKEIENMHSDGIKTMQVYSTIGHSRGPFVVSASVDGTVAISDIEYPTGVLSTTPAAFAAAYELDYQAERAGLWVKYGHWPRISAIHKKVGSLPFREYPGIFAKAVRHQKHDFLEMFRGALVEVLPYIGDVASGKNALDYAIDRKDEETVKVLLDCWVQCLNTDVGTIRSQLYVHPSHYLPLSTLLKLSTYPFLFQNFICSIRMVRSCPEVAANCHYAVLSPVHHNFVVTCGVDDTFDLWGRILGNDTAEGFPVTALYIPLSNASSIGMIELYVKVAKELGDTSIMECAVVQTALRQAWDSAGRARLNSEARKFFLFLLWYCIWLYSFSDLMSNEEGGPYHAWNNHVRHATGYISQIVMILLCASFMRVLAKRMRCKLLAHSRHDEIHSFQNKLHLAINYCTDIWSMQDILSMVGTIIGAGARIAHGHESLMSRIFLAPTSFLLFFKALYFLRPLESSGPLVAMILEISNSIRFFLFILFVVLAGFSQAFWLLYPLHTYAERRFHIIQNFYIGYMAMLGDFDSDTSVAVSPALAGFMLAIFLLFMNVLMLNLLIALMGDVYARMSEAKGSWRLNQAEIILDMTFDAVNVDDILPDFSEGSAQPYLHVLKYTAQLDNQQARKVVVSAAEDMNDNDNNNDDDEQEKRKASNEVVVANNVALGEKVDGMQSQIDSMELKVDSMESRLKEVTTKLDLILMHLQQKS